MRIQLRNRIIVAEADTIGLVEGNTRATVSARSNGTAGVSSPGHALERTLQELGKSLLVSRANKREAVRPSSPGQAPTVRDADCRGANRGTLPSTAPPRDNRRRSRTDEEEAYDPVVSDEGGEPQGSRQRGGHGTHWRKGVNRNASWTTETRRYPDIETPCLHNLPN